MFEFFKKEKKKTYRYTLSENDLSKFLEELINYSEIDSLQDDISYLQGVIETMNRTERASGALQRLVSTCQVVQGLYSWSINKEEVNDEDQT